MEPVLPLAEIPLKGAHNVENVLAAVCAARLAGVSAESIRESVKSFQAVEHRLQFVAQVRGVDYYNDSKATNVDATMKALASFAGGIHLILGGKDKGSDYTLLAPLIKERVKSVYTIGSAAEKITNQLTAVSKISAGGDAGEGVNLAAARLSRVRSCCWRRHAPALTSLPTTNTADGVCGAGEAFEGSEIDGEARRRR